VIVIGGIYSRLFTPIEAAAMSAMYAFVVAVFVYRDLRLAEVPRAMAGVGPWLLTMMGFLILMT